jgi:hypothetical protein
LLGLAVVSIGATGAAAAPRLKTGFADGTLFDRAVDARASVARLPVAWRAVVGGRPDDPRNPADPAYNFSGVDALVNAATERGLRVLLTVSHAPAWAEGPNRPSGATAGSWKPSPRAYGNFARALAKHYSGGAFPRVRFYQAWNEPNLNTYLAPQYRGRKAKSPARYRRLLNAFYAGVNSVRRSNVVVTGGTAPYGDPPGGNRMRPQIFLRKLFCLKRRRALDPTRCRNRPRLDVLAHHPINTIGGPNSRSLHPDDASTAEFKDVRRILRAAERSHRVRPRGRRPLWATELWWESDPPDEFVGVKLRKHARWYQEALRVLWKQGARVVILLQVIDSPYDPGNPSATLQSGILFQNGDTKPAFRAVRFPFVTERRSRSRVRAWALPPATGTLRVQRRRHGNWRTLKRERAHRGRPVSTSLRLRGGARLRARVGDLQSLAWRQGG